MSNLWELLGEKYSLRVYIFTKWEAFKKQFSSFLQLHFTLKIKAPNCMTLAVLIALQASVFDNDFFAVFIIIRFVKTIFWRKTCYISVKNATKKLKLTFMLIAGLLVWVCEFPIGNSLCCLEILDHLNWEKLDKVTGKKHPILFLKPQ